jgi:two-component system OmpR family response regulator
MEKKLSVLIVDDNEDFCVLLTNLLGKSSYDITTCSTVNCGFTNCREIKPDILFLDNQLSDGYGWEMIKEFKEYASVIFLVTGYDYLRTAELMQPDVYMLPKPFEVENLKSILSNRFQLVE